MVPPLVAPSATPQRFIGHASAILCNHRGPTDGATTRDTIGHASAILCDHRGLTDGATSGSGTGHAPKIAKVATPVKPRRYFAITEA